MALTGTCCNDDKAAQNLLLQLPSYTPTYQIKNNEQGGGGVFYFYFLFKLLIIYFTLTVVILQ